MNGNNSIATRDERLQELYDFVSQHPDIADKTVIATYCERTGLGKSQAYIDLAQVKKMAASMSKTSREFHRFRANEMLLETYKKAKEKDDIRTMERVAGTYAKINRVDIDAMKEENPLDAASLQVQPFTATEDPSVLGIKPIQNLEEHIKKLLNKYGATTDIEDIDGEEVDTEII